MVWFGFGSVSVVIVVAFMPLSPNMAGRLFEYQAVRFKFRFVLMVLVVFGLDFVWKVVCLYFGFVG